MKVTSIHGDIIAEIDTGYYDYVAHGCNCMGVMGSGVAPILNKYTLGSLLLKDRRTPLGDINKLGSFSVVSHPTKEGSIVDICNFYTQFEPRTTQSTIVVVHWESYKNCLTELLDMANIQDGDVNILMPMIGCGLAGGQLSDLLSNTREAVHDYLVANEIDSDGSSITFVSNQYAMAKEMGRLIDLM